MFSKLKKNKGDNPPKVPYFPPVKQNTVIPSVFIDEQRGNKYFFFCFKTADFNSMNIFYTQSRGQRSGSMPTMVLKKVLCVFQKTLQPNR